MEQLIPKDAHSFEVFAIKDSKDSPTGKEAFIGFKLSNGDFHFISVPFTEPPKKTSKDWYESMPEKEKVVIMDPDGWDRSNYEYSFNEELITEEEFHKRLCSSTCMWKTSLFKK